jgi:hypothetical protein
MQGIMGLTYCRFQKWGGGDRASCWRAGKEGESVETKLKGIVVSIVSRQKM